ncbi:glycosyltransferase [Microbacterium soli]|uniref:Glycosyltransferase n=1 Tax=Microbacterium soli TaxID=446075 RepID=A0ABP7MS10_9MICO
MRNGPHVHVFPDWKDNPYLNLLSLAPTAQGFQFSGRTTYPSLLATLRDLRRDDTMHFHWTAPIVQSAPSRWKALRRVRTLAAELDAAKSRGAHVIWTIHNRMPHELDHPEAERKLYGVLADAADVIHIMSPATADVLADIVHLPEDKVLQIPHPSYAGVYDTEITRAQARESMQLADNEYAVLFLGQVRPYKGIDMLLAATAGITRVDGKRPVLLLAGAASPEAVAQFDDLRPDGLRTVTSFTPVPDEEIARWYRAADVAVFPYRAILNSGSVHLAATMHVPVILPGLPHLTEQFREQRWVRFFDTEHPVDSLRSVLSDQDFDGLDELDFERFTAPISPWRVSQRYGDVLRRLSSTQRA